MEQRTSIESIQLGSCWICGAPADSREHKAKRSDLRDIFGHVSQKTPLVLNDLDNRNRKIGSLNAVLLKRKRSICHFCNTTRSQPHDVAWETMSEGIRSRMPTISPGSAVRANRIFRTNTSANMMAVHLYFVKAFGCLLAEIRPQTGMDIKELANCIICNKAHPDIYLAFGVWDRKPRLPTVSASDIYVCRDRGGSQIELATWFYNVNGLITVVAYAPGNGGRLWARKEQLWHPRNGSNRLEIKRISRAP